MRQNCTSKFSQKNPWPLSHSKRSYNQIVIWLLKTTHYRWSSFKDMYNLKLFENHPCEPKLVRDQLHSCLQRNFGIVFTYGWRMFHFMTSHCLGMDPKFLPQGKKWKFSLEKMHDQVIRESLYQAKYIKQTNNWAKYFYHPNKKYIYIFRLLVVLRLLSPPCLMGKNLQRFSPHSLFMVPLDGQSKSWTTHRLI